jgi:hypothetical protein
MRKLLAGYSMLLFCTAAVAQSNNNFQKKRLLFEDDFSGVALSNLWIVENAEKGSGSCSVVDGRLQLNTTGGITVWYKNKLAGNVLIEYDRTVVIKGGTNDRMSDLNQFWMATDPRKKLFSRKGDFREYDSLQLYYVGMGGNDNSTTRMRRYDGKGNLQIVGEYKDSLHLLRPNKTYHIAIFVKDGVSKFLVDGEEYFSFKDARPFTEGWFAIRSTKSRQWIDNVKIYSLAD